MLKIKKSIIYILYFAVLLTGISTKVIASDNDINSSLFLGIGGHTLGLLPTPTLDIGVDTPVANMRVRYPFLGVGRISMELAARYDSNIRGYPYITYGRNYYVVGFHSFVGIGIEYVFKSGRSYFLAEVTRQGLRPGETDIDFDPENTISFGIGVRNYKLW